MARSESRFEDRDKGSGYTRTVHIVFCQSTIRSRMRASQVAGAALLCTVDAFMVGSVSRPLSRARQQRFLATPTSTCTTDSLIPPRAGRVLQFLLDFALQSPLWRLVLVPQARKKMADTASANGIPWEECKRWIQSQHWTTTTTTPTTNDNDTSFQHDHAPDYYQKAAFHAYEQGNLCWDAALEVEIVSAAVGARNFPAYGRLGEDAFRRAFHLALTEHRAVPISVRRAV